MWFTRHFQLREFEVTNTGVLNHVPERLYGNLQALCSAVLQPLRYDVGPLQVTSGYRSPEVNLRVGGSARSAHLRALAADVIPETASRLEAWNVLVGMVHSGFMIDQVICYRRLPHLHIGIRAGDRIDPRGELLVCEKPGVYRPWTEDSGFP